jgi:hypothetical protein
LIRVQVGELGDGSFENGAIRRSTRSAATTSSAIVNMPPEATDLDIALTPWRKVYLPQAFC